MTRLEFGKKPFHIEINELRSMSQDVCFIIFYAWIAGSLPSCGRTWMVVLANDVMKRTMQEMLAWSLISFFFIKLIVTLHLFTINFDFQFIYRQLMSELDCLKT